MSPIIPVPIEQELSSSYLDYAMSVIVSRAIPDARDGLKPVQRRILYSMYELGLYPDKPYKKSARIVGDTLGKFHPHGDVPVYEALVRLAQDFTMRYPLIDGQGNFGSPDDPPAAMRYTEARLSKIAMEMLADIDKGTVDFVPNFDGSFKEPSVLPARLPNLLVNGCLGIAVGMSTNIPPHNLSEICNALAFLIDNPDADLSQILKFVKGPDFPTGGVILGRRGIEEAYRTGMGKIVLQAKAYVEKRKGKSQIIITSIPYQVSKTAILERIASLSREGRIDGISQVRDESDKGNIRVVVELKKEAYPEVVLNQLYHLTPLRQSLQLNFLVLVDGRPKTCGLIELMRLYLDHRYKVALRRACFEKDLLKERAHILDGLVIALDNLDKVIAIIKSSPDAEAAKQTLIKELPLSPTQAQAILEMPLRRLCSLERGRLLEEHERIKGKIEKIEELLGSPNLIWEGIKREVLELAEKYPSERRTEIGGEVERFSLENLIPPRKVVVALAQGYIKRLSWESIRGKRLSLQAEKLIPLNIKSLILFIDQKGGVYRIKAFKIPEVERGSRGIPLSSLLPIKGGEVVGILEVESFKEGEYLILATASGRIKRVRLSEFGPQRRQGIKALKLGEDDKVVGVTRGCDGDEVVLISHWGRAVRFPLNSLPILSRKSKGVCGQKLKGGDGICFVGATKNPSHIFLITEKGYGISIPLSSIPSCSPGSFGKRIMGVDRRTGTVIGASFISPSGRVAVLLSGGITYILGWSELPLNRDRVFPELKEGEVVLALTSLD